MVDLLYIVLSLSLFTPPIYFGYKIILEEYIKDWMEARKRAAYDAYIDSEVKRRKALRAEMVRLGYDRENMTYEDLDQLSDLFKEEFPVLYEDKE